MFAHAMEQEAANRYDGLAEDMRRQNKTDLGAVFARLAAAERVHVDSVTHGRNPAAEETLILRWCVGRRPRPWMPRRRPR